MAKHYDKQFKLDAIQYYHDHTHIDWYSNIWRHSITPSESIVIAITCHQMTTKNYTVDCNRTKSQWQVKMGKTSF